MDLTFTEQLQLFIANHPVMIIAWIVVFAATVYTLYKGATSKFSTVETAKAIALINQEEGVFLDVRADEEFKAGHIVDSVSIHPSDIKSGNVGNIEKYKAKPVIVVDSNGFSANPLADKLAKLGFAKVYVLKEGVLGWRSANLPLVKKK